MDEVFGILVTDKNYRDNDDFAYHKNRIQQLFYYTFQAEKSKTEFHNCFIIDFKREKVNKARKTINKHRRLNMQITQLSASE